MKFSYTVFPDDVSSLPKFPLDEGKSETATFFAFSGLAIMVVGGIWLLVNLFTGGYGWVICLVLWIINVIIFRAIQNEANKEHKEEKVKNQAESFSNQLNEILFKSEEIVNNILPYYEASAKQHLDIAKTDFSDNAISPFWDKVEEASKCLALYKEAIDQLIINGEIYSAILRERKHNFPTPFPIGTNISTPKSILDDFNSIVRKAQTKFEFANIWEQRKTQKILIAGFQTLSQAIYDMSNAIVYSIDDLKHSISSDFRQLHNIQIEQMKSFEASHSVLNSTLTSMDKKLYFIQYKEKPLRPFIRPLSDY